jgi:hypothetical protein
VLFSSPPHTFDLQDGSNKNSVESLSNRLDQNEGRLMVVVDRVNELEHSFKDKEKIIRKYEWNMKYLWDYKHMIKARAHKGGVKIGKTPKKLASICCP